MNFRHKKQIRNQSIYVRSTGRYLQPAGTKLKIKLDLNVSEYDGHFFYRPDHEIILVVHLFRFKRDNTL